jgi:hypothetical protein
MNALDRFLYRRQGNSPAEPVGVVTDFKVGYINGQFAPISFPLASDSVHRTIRQIEVSLEVQNSDAPYRSRDSILEGERDALYSGIVWKQTRLVVQNLDR